jgi:uncharacterized protein YacL
MVNDAGNRRIQGRITMPVFLIKELLKKAKSADFADWTKNTRGLELSELDDDTPAPSKKTEIDDEAERLMSIARRVH